MKTKILNKETFKPIPGYSNYYCSKSGKILNATTGRILKYDYSRPYLRATLSKDGKVKKHFVHRLVAYSWIGRQPTQKHQINHINGIKHDNRADNLEWCTHQENQDHARKYLYKQPIGTELPWSKLNENIVRQIRKSWPNKSARSMAKELNLSKTTVLRCVHRKTWAHVK